MTDYKKIKAEYIRGEASLRRLAEKYGVSFSSLRKVSAREKWTDLRNTARAKRDTKIAEKIGEREAARVDKLQSLADMLMDKIADGVGDSTLVPDAQSIRQITAALKDLREIKGYKTDLDLQEQMARIDKLRKEAERGNEDKDRQISVVISSGLEDYSK